MMLVNAKSDLKDLSIVGVNNAVKQLFFYNLL